MKMDNVRCDMLMSRWAGKVEPFVNPLGNLRGRYRDHVTVGVKIVGHVAGMPIDGDLARVVRVTRFVGDPLPAIRWRRIRLREPFRRIDVIKMLPDRVTG